MKKVNAVGVEKFNISGPRILMMRKRLKWKQVELAAAISVDFSYPIEQSDISEIERGVRGVKDFELKYFSEVLGVSADWLLGGEHDEQ